MSFGLILSINISWPSFPIERNTLKPYVIANIPPSTKADPPDPITNLLAPFSMHSFITFPLPYKNQLICKSYERCGFPGTSPFFWHHLKPTRISYLHICCVPLYHIIGCLILISQRSQYFNFFDLSFREDRMHAIDKTISSIWNRQLNNFSWWEVLLEAIWYYGSKSTWRKGVLEFIKN
jgi:hypothetical protein